MAVNATANGAFQMDVFAKNLKCDEVIEGQIQRLNGENVGKPFTIKQIPEVSFSN